MIVMVAFLKCVFVGFVIGRIFTFYGVFDGKYDFALFAMSLYGYFLWDLSSSILGVDTFLAVVAIAGAAFVHIASYHRGYDECRLGR
jgi:hypothetical protein